MTELLVVAGLIHGLTVSGSTAFPRYGAVIALTTFWHAYVQQRYLSMLQHDAELIARELGEELGRDPSKTIAHLKRLRRSVHRSSNMDYLNCRTIGVLVCGWFLYGERRLPASLVGLHNLPYAATALGVSEMFG